MVSSSHMKLLLETTQGSDDDNEVNETEDFDGKHYFVGSFCFTVVNGSCVIPSLERSASHILFLVIFVPVIFFPFFVSLGISNVVLAY